MRKDKIAAAKLRLSGKSYTEIMRALGVPKSTLSGWFSDVVLSDNLRRAIAERTSEKSLAGLLRHNKNQTFLAQKRALQNRREGMGAVGAISQRDLFVIGVALYWAEGYKRLKIRNRQEITHHPISLTNSDPHLVKMFLKFVRECLHVPEEKIKASIRIFEHHNEKTLLKFWQRETNIPPQNFKKTYYGISRSSQGKRPFNRLPNGVIQIVVADTPLFHKIMGHIEGFKNLV